MLSNSPTSSSSDTSLSPRGCDKLMQAFVFAQMMLNDPSILKAFKKLEGTDPIQMKKATLEAEVQLKEFKDIADVILNDFSKDDYKSDTN